MNPYATLAYPRVRLLAWQPAPLTASRGKRVEGKGAIYVALRIDDWLVIRGIPVWEGRTGEPMFSLPANISLHDADLLAQLRGLILDAYRAHIDAASLLLRE